MLEVSKLIDAKEYLSRHSVVLFDLDDTIYPEKEYVKKSVVSKSSVTVKNLKGTAKFKIKAYCKVNGKTVTGKASSVKKIAV